jgi:hypothetical protein
MSKIDQIESELKQIDQAKFQKLCDHYLTDLGYEIKSYGSATGKNKTKGGTPDSYIILSNGNFIFVEYTTQSTGVVEKFLKDLDSCFNEEKTKIPVSKIEKIFFCYNGKISPEGTSDLIKKCRDYNCECEFIDIDKLKYAIFNYPQIGIDYLNINPDTGQILKLNDFLKEYSRGKFATTLDNQFYFRTQDLEKAERYLANGNLLIISGKAGIGKTKFAIEAINQFVNKNPNTQFYCIWNKNHEDLYYELKSYFKINESYILLVDDANRITQFEYILDLLNRDNINIKLVATVRDYALDNILEKSKNYSKEHLFLSNLTDKEIVEILSEYNFNNRCLNTIQSISDGNPRLAMMAAKIAHETNNINSLHDATSLYDEYFLDISKKMTDPYLLKVLGVISFFRFLNRGDKVMKEIYQEFQIPEDIFWDKVIELHHYEVVDLEEQDKQMVKISDQILGTYFFYKVFIKDNILPYKSVLLTFFENYTGKVKESTYPAFNSFKYTEVLDKISDALAAKLESVKNNESETLSFFETFWFCKKAETLSFIKDKIANLQKSDAVDFNFTPREESGSFSVAPHLKVLQIFHAHHDEYFEYSLELIFEYVFKKPDTLPDVVKFISETLSFNHNDYEDDYFMQKTLFNFLFQKTKNSDQKDFFKKIIFTVVNNFLNTSYSKTGASNQKNQIAIYNFTLPPTDTIKNLRGEIWSFLLNEYENNKEQVYSIFHKHIHNSEIDSESEILEADQPFIKLFFERLDPQHYKHCKLINTYIKRMLRHDVNVQDESKTLQNKFSSPSYKLSILLQWNYERINNREVSTEEYDKLKKEQLSNYFKEYTFNQYESLFNRIKEIVAEEERDSFWMFSQSFNTILTALKERDQDLFFEVMENLLANKNPLQFSPNKIFFINLKFNSENKLKYYELIKQYDFQYKEFWITNFLESLTKDEVTTYYAKELITLYSFYRGYGNLHLGFIKNYIHIVPNILSTIISILLENAKKKELEFEIFNDDFIEDLLSESPSNLALAKETYLYLKNSNRRNYYDHEGQGLSRLLKEDSGFIKVYLAEKHKGTLSSIYDDHTNYSFIWKMDNHNVIINLAFEFILNNPELPSRNHSLNVFFKGVLNTPEKERLLQLTRHFIEEYHNDKSALKLIFYVITHSLKSELITFLKQFLNLNQDIAIFNSLYLTSGSGSGSIVAHYEKHLEFWETLDKEVHGVKLLGHKAEIQTRINSCKYSIKEHLKREFLNEY